MLARLSDYELIILDGYGTLYDKFLLPLPGSRELLNIISSKSILFSNVGSMTGHQLKSKLKPNFKSLPGQVITSLDILINYLKHNNFINICHYGGSKTAKLLIQNGISVIPFGNNSNIIVFTSLPSNNWIKDSQSVLKIINSSKSTQLILSNPDRLLPGKHVGINVGMMFDMLVKSWPKKIKDSLNIIEIGKPGLTRFDLGIKNEENIVVIGDNIITDGGLAQNLNCDFNLISKDNISESKQVKVYETLSEIMNNE
jgi:ribonucleotide monophosphatase NagD (HAD superfamily)